MVTKARRPKAGRAGKRLPREQAAKVALSDEENEREDPRAWAATAKLSSKRQITLPAAMVRALGLKPGDELDLLVMYDAIWMERRPQTAKEWNARLKGSLAHLPGWGSKEEIDAWVRRERDSWDREWDQDDQAGS